FIVENGVVRKVPIKTDIDDGVWVEVTSGLSGDEEVVVGGKSRDSGGAKVNASPSNLPAGKPASQKYYSSTGMQVDHGRAGRQPADCSAEEEEGGRVA